MQRLLLILLLPIAASGQVRTNQPPSLLSQPVSVRTKVGQDVILSVSVRSATPASIYWRKNGVGISNGLSDRLTMRSVTVSDTGVYDVMVLNSDGVVFSDPFSVTVDAGRMINLSVRIVVADSGVLIAGFVVDAPKRVLVRAVGRSLEQFGVAHGSSMPNPRVELYDSSGKLVVGNDDFSSGPVLNAAMAQSGAFPLTSPQDAAVVTEVQVGSYTVHLRPSDGKGGDALVEVYDLG
jgi:hypothetical protein